MALRSPHNSVLSPGLWTGRGKPHIVRQLLLGQLQQRNGLVGSYGHRRHALDGDVWSTLLQQGGNRQAVIKVKTSSDGQHGTIWGPLQKRRQGRSHGVVLHLRRLDKAFDLRLWEGMGGSHGLQKVGAVWRGKGRETSRETGPPGGGGPLPHTPVALLVHAARHPPRGRLGRGYGVGSLGVV